VNRSMPADTPDGCPGAGAGQLGAIGARAACALSVLPVLAALSALAVVAACGRLPPPPSEALASSAARATGGPAISPAAGTPSLDPAAAAGGVPVTVARSASWRGRLPAGVTALTAAQARPVRLRVAALGLDAPVVAAGVAADGRLQLPGDAHTVAWFVGGAVPGDSGSAVLAAHVDYGGAKGPFFELADLPAGAEIEVHLADGGHRTFRSVADPDARAKSELPVDQLFRRGGEPSLTLVTCGGDFDPAARAYAQNTLVTASPA